MALAIVTTDDEQLRINERQHVYCTRTVVPPIKFGKEGIVSESARRTIRGQICIRMCESFCYISFSYVRFPMNISLEQGEMIQLN